MFSDGSYCEEWSFMNGECQPGDIMYNTISEEEVVAEEDVVAADLSTHTPEEIDGASSVITNYFENEMTVDVDVLAIDYLGDTKSAQELDYCKGLNPEVEDCLVFSSDFYIPQQNAEMAGAFEPDKTLTDYLWYLGKVNGEWKVLTMGY